MLNQTAQNASRAPSIGFSTLAEMAYPWGAQRKIFFPQQDPPGSTSAVFTTVALVEEQHCLQASDGFQAAE